LQPPAWCLAEGVFLGVLVGFRTGDADGGDGCVGVGVDIGDGLDERADVVGDSEGVTVAVGDGGIQHSVRLETTVSIETDLGNDDDDDDDDGNDDAHDGDEKSTFLPYLHNPVSFATEVSSQTVESQIDVVAGVERENTGVPQVEGSCGPVAAGSYPTH